MEARRTKRELDKECEKMRASLQAQQDQAKQELSRAEVRDSHDPKPSFTFLTTMDVPSSPINRYAIVGVVNPSGLSGCVGGVAFICRKVWLDLNGFLHNSVHSVERNLCLW